MLVAVALDDRDDELLADVPRKVEVDVGHRDELAIEEASKSEPRGDGIDVREAREVADDRADRASSSPSGRKKVPRRAGAAHLVRDLARKLEHLPVEEEEAREPELGDERELLAQAGVRARSQILRRVPVTLLECARAHLGELHVGRVRAVREIGIAIAELVSEVELEPLGQLDGRPDGIPVSGKRAAASAGEARTNSSF